MTIIRMSQEQYDRFMEPESDEAPPALREMVLRARYPRLMRLFDEPSVFDKEST